MAGRTFGHTRDERLTVWSLTLPQVAATLAARAGCLPHRQPCGRAPRRCQLLNVVLVLVLTTSLGPVPTERFAPRLPTESPAIA